MEGAAAAYCTSSGMAAIAGTLLELCSSGDHIVASSTVYGGTFGLLKVSLVKPRVRRLQRHCRVLLRRRLAIAPRCWLRQLLSLVSRRHGVRTVLTTVTVDTLLLLRARSGLASVLQDYLPRKCGINTTFVNITDMVAVAAAITDRWATPHAAGKA
jgi:hypothetical protein